MHSTPDIMPPDTGERRRALCAVAAIAALTCPQAARGRGTADWDKSQTTLQLDDPEVQEVRKTQSNLRLYDLKRGRFMKLTEALRPGELLYDADAVFLGELHDSAADHVVHRLIIDALAYQRFVKKRAENGEAVSSMTGGSAPPSLAVGVEYFSIVQQKAIDDYMFGDGKPKLADLRRATDWDEIWKYDWQLYAPLFRYCQLTETRLLGLNVPLAASTMVSRSGWQNAPSWLTSALPELDLSKQRHRRRFEDMLTKPLEDAVSGWPLPLEGFRPRADLDNMYDAQTLWDEYMAKSCFKYLDTNSGRLVVCAGLNHVWRDAMPERFEARATRSGRSFRAASVVPWRSDFDLNTLRGCADYVWLTDGPCGGAEALDAMQAQRARLKGKSRVFPAGFI